MTMTTTATTKTTTIAMAMVAMAMNGKKRYGGFGGYLVDIWWLRGYFSEHILGGLFGLDGYTGEYYCLCWDDRKMLWWVYLVIVFLYKTIKK
jgi:hypothetical protein